MKFLKKIGWFLLAFVIIFVLTASVFTYSISPDYDGERELDGLSGQVDVHYDPYGIPHIYAGNEKDAFRALGYVHAQDRLWQMELLRRIASGGLSEVFGKDLVVTDKFFLALGIDDASAETAEQLDKNSTPVALSQAYLDGVNEFVRAGETPIEFYLTGIEKEEFELKDIYNTIGYMAFSFAMAHKTDPLLTNINNKLGAEYLKDLAIQSDTGTIWIKNYRATFPDAAQNNISTMVTKALGEIGLPLFEGSNSWVIASEKTRNGKVILANDPHIGFGQPAVWYEAHVNTPSYTKYGYHLAGVPFPILAHNRQLAYGVTMFENDDIDFYYEETNPLDSTQYRVGDSWNDYENISRTIKVKDTASITFTYRKTRNGPILTGIADQVTGERPISMYWVYTQMENKLMDALYEMSHAHNLEEFTRAIPKIHAPGLNMMYGDAKGNIAWFAAGKLYDTPDSVNTKLIRNGTLGHHTPPRLLDFSENPQAVNPPWHYVYSANNQPDSVAGRLYPGYYLPENRAKRIVQLLEPKNDWDRQSVAEMITDVTSSVNPLIVTGLTEHIKESELSETQLALLDDLNAWKGNYPLGGTEATIFHRWIYYVLKNTFHDELDDELFEQFLSTHFHKRLIAPLVRNPKSVWWDDINTTDTVETEVDIVNRSFVEALASLEKDFGLDVTSYTWDKVHTLEHNHPIGQIAALRPFFNVGPFPVEGTREVINNMYFGYNETGMFKVGSGPSTRRVIDFSDVENSVSILPTGQSGNPLSPHYKDQAEMYVKGQFRKMLINKVEIEKTAKSVLVFRPSKK